MSSERVEPDLPITPMLDMSFQLMAFFILTFSPKPVEGQLSLSLPKEEGGPSNVAPSVDLTEDEDVVVQIYASDNGNIADISIAPKTGSYSIGKDTSALFKFLKEKAAAATAEKKPAPKLRLEMADQLNYQFVIKLLDEGKRAGFERISPAALTPAAAGGAAKK
ncbi:ExbD/TolR family protein [Fimbriiglobus ruber]|uniref:Biopolymer transport protein ExbD/TolR n=1 Tax=Fimbriiglobus ruber TaxID=1908690 RepID=A0A225E398_9BACT|nr:biopolymer transporter ExbD [Fimbriiglobus ruber]OWK43155.1 hypothetical protein FRUB_02754 [Fimbriiglobus ruber]